MKRITTLSCALAAIAFGAVMAADSPKQVKPYPLKTCAVSGEKLDSMGKPYVFTNADQEVKLCCKDCLKDFNKDQAKYMKKIAKAEKK
ncbi:MAG TPA: hypothetical protein VK850_17955 [Candidatus Binatia bacterium]|nr:hypothetical protein [Candidatus Binatia bacterium]